MDEQKQKLIERIKQGTNILVTVSANPSVDQLASAIGLTIALNKLDKHATAVFSGQVPSTIEFLKPEETLEKDTNSLRDFIIALDKSKADKLRYKVEDQVVRIFITPYRTSISQDDLEFSQGDFNVDVVIALGVTEQQDLDAAITAHGRILHDAAVASVTNTAQGSLGTINWIDPQSSSLSEMVVGLVDGLDKKLMDNQIATALLTGIVASTDRFRNEKTSPKTMSASATLMAAGANQQLIASELETPAAPVEPAPMPAAEGDSAEPGKKEPGMLEIAHEGGEPPAPAPPAEPVASEEPAVPEEPQIQVSEDGQLLDGAGLPMLHPDNQPLPQISHVHGVTDGGNEPTGEGPAEVKRGMITAPPSLGDSNITANSSPQFDEEETPAAGLNPPVVDGPILKHNQTVLNPLSSKLAASPPPAAAPEPLSLPPIPAPAPPAPVFQPAPPSWTPPEPPAMPPAPAPAPLSKPPVPPSDATLSQIEQQVGSSHVQITEDGTFTNAATVPPAPAAAAPAPGPVPTANVDDARSAVQAALNNVGAPKGPLEPIAALNAQPLGPELRAPEPAAPGAPVSTVIPNPGFKEPTPGGTPADSTLDMPLPSNPFGPGQQAAPPAPAAPPVSSFPGAPAPSTGPPPPPVPPPLVPPVQ
ncbi:MAG TPA: hypothetical protein VLF40_02825 [Candidatus Saccharimonadales bacterium]|nr:hypothetical protein [Candidatus Saccharimonadales bacterium]